MNLAKNTRILADAAIDAGIKRIILSEFGGFVLSSLRASIVIDVQRSSDFQNSPRKDRPILQVKVDAQAYVEGKAKEGKTTWTTISVGPFFDWGLVQSVLGFGALTLGIECGARLTTFVDLKNKKATLFDGGNHLFHSTTLDSIGKSVVGVLSRPAATENKPIRVHDFFVTQKDILALLEAELGPFTVQDVGVSQLIEHCNAGLARGEFNEANILGLLQAYIFGAESSFCRWPKEDDSALLGLPKRDIKEEVKKVLATL